MSHKLVLLLGSLLAFSSAQASIVTLEDRSLKEVAEPCIVTKASVEQINVQLKNGKREIQRQMRLENLKLVGVTESTPELILNHYGDEDGKSVYIKRARRKYTTDESIVITASTGDDKFDGVVLPNSMTVTVTKSNGENVKAYRCRVEVRSVGVADETAPQQTTR